jgi:sigma-E factor negative regulatory protein RseA
LFAGLTLDAPMHNPSSLSPAELLSALADDQLPDDPAALDRLLAAWTDDPSLAQAWRDSHWLSDALRSGAQALPPASMGFAAGVLERLALEAPLQAPPSPALTAPAANDGVFRWKLVAGVASLTAAVAVVWQLTAGAPAVSNSGAQLAQGDTATPRITAVVTERGVLLRDPELDALLAAHRQQGGVSALQMPAGFLRDATYEVPAR